MTATPCGSGQTKSTSGAMNQYEQRGTAMAISNHDRVGKALDLLKEGLRPFVEREMQAHYGQRWFEAARTSVSDSQAHLFGTPEEPRWDAAAALARDVEAVERRLPQDARPGRTQSGERAARRAQPLGAPGAVL